MVTSVILPRCVTETPFRALASFSFAFATGGFQRFPNRRLTENKKRTMIVLLVALEIQGREDTLSGSLKFDKGFQLRSFMASSISLALIVFSRGISNKRILSYSRC